MATILTPDLVMSKSKCDNINTVKNLNLWGNNLENMQLLRRMQNVEVLSLSVNKIQSLEDFAFCTKLSELYLRKNNIKNIQEIRHLAGLKNLKVLWLQENPCADTESNYRDIVIKVLPNLQKLDNLMVTPEERQKAEKIQLNWDITSNNSNINISHQTSVNSNMNNVEPQQGFLAENKNVMNIQQQKENQQPGYLQQIKENNQNLVQQSSYKKPSSSYHQQSSPSQGISQNQSSSQLKNNSQAQQQILDNQKAQHLKEKKMTNDNILCAVMALVKELDNNSLEIIKRDVERRIQANNNNN